MWFFAFVKNLFQFLIMLRSKRKLAEKEIIING